MDTTDGDCHETTRTTSRPSGSSKSSSQRSRTPSEQRGLRPMLSAPDAAQQARYLASCYGFRSGAADMVEPWAVVLGEQRKSVAIKAVRAARSEHARFPPTAGELENICARFLAAENKAERAEQDAPARAAEQARAKAEAYLAGWIEQHTAEPWYCERIADAARSDERIEQRPGLPGQRIWLAAYLEGWHRRLEAWVVAEAERQCREFPAFPIEVPAPPADVVEG